MDSCKQDVALKKNALKRRSNLIHKKEVPYQKELLNQHGEDLGNIILDQMSYTAKDLMYVNYKHNKPTSNLWIAPETKSVCVSETHTENIKALTHQGILEIGGHIEKKFESKMRKLLNDAIQDNSEFDRFEFEKRMKFAIQCEKNKCAQKIQKVTEDLKRKYDEEKMLITIMYEKDYQTKLNSAVNDMKNNLQELLKMQQQNCTNDRTSKDIDKINSKTSLSVPGSLKEDSIKNQTGEDIEYCIRQQQNIMQCSNISDVIHLICTEKLEYQRKAQELERKYCDKINLLKKHVFEICCKIEAIKCNCSSLPRTAKATVKKERTIAFKFCQCAKNPDCEKTNLKKVTKVKTLQKRENPNAKKKEFAAVNEQCSICKAKQLCNSLKKQWSSRVSNSGSAHNQETFNLSDFGSPKVDEIMSRTHIKKKLNTFVTAVFPEEIGKEIYCDCQSSSSDECPCLKTNYDKEQLPILDVQWKKVRRNEVFNLNNVDENTFEEVMETCMELDSDCKESLSTISQTGICNSKILHADFIQNLLNDLNALQMVDIFNSLTKHEIQDSEFVKDRFLHELCKRMEKYSCTIIPNRFKVIRESTSTTATTDSDFFQRS